MTDKKKRVFALALLVLSLALTCVASGCGIGEDKVLNLQDRVRAIYWIALDNDKLSMQQKDELKTHHTKLHQDIGGLK